MPAPVDRSRATWWWIFALLIAMPAVSLAVLGLRTIRLDRVEWEQQIRERQSQTTRLVDAALRNALTVLEAARPPASDVGPKSLSEAPDPSGYRRFSIDAESTVTFVADRVYFPGEAASHPQNRIQRSAALERLIAESQAAAAQGRDDDALKLLDRIASTDASVADWARWMTARTRHALGDATALAALAHPRWGLADGLTPSGLPVALVASGYADRVSPEDQAQFVPLLHETLRALRSGAWWLSFDERRFYDGELRRLSQSAGGEYAPAVAPDPQLDELETLADMVRRAAPRRGTAGRTAERLHNRTWLLLWSSAERPETDQTMGLALSDDDVQKVAEGAIRQLATGDGFSFALRDTTGETLWRQTNGDFDATSVQSLQAVPGWDLAFSEPAVPAALSRRRALWYGLMLVLVLMLSTGLGMTARARRQDLAFAQRQATFVAAVSHEFKSPLTSIRLYMERLSSGRVAASESSEYYTAVDQEAARLERLVNRLLDSQQLQEGRKTYALEPASISDAARIAIGRLRPQAEAKGVRLELHEHEGDADACFDRSAIADAIENLIENAIKYSPHGSNVEVATMAVSDAVRVEVQDRGIGIDAQDVPRIFDKFFRGRRGNAADVRGTGLGLSLVKAIVDGHGGTIDVTSVPGSGSSFSLTLPRRSDARTEATG